MVVKLIWYHPRRKGAPIIYISDAPNSIYFNSTTVTPNPPSPASP